MKGFKGTKGEWECEGIVRVNKYDVKILYIDFNDSVECVSVFADMRKENHLEELESNAKLIAAAPELLEALVDVTNELYNAIECLHGKETAEINDNIKKADLAISKALD